MEKETVTAALEDTKLRGPHPAHATLPPQVSSQPDPAMFPCFGAVYHQVPLDGDRALKLHSLG